jgi:hypothetical protein
MNILVPESTWSAMLDAFAAHGPDVERVAYLDGYAVQPAGDGPPVGLVTTLVLPAAELARGFYNVSAPAMSAAGQHLREYGMQRLAQVHTHGGSDTRHSPTDDGLAYSQRVGTVSIVAPAHASTRPAPADCGIHARQVDGWVKLAPARAADLVRLVPSQLDLRDPPCLRAAQPSSAIFSRLLAWLRTALPRRP